MSTTLLSHKETPLLRDARPKAWLEIGLVIRMNRAIANVFGNHSGWAIPTPTMVRKAPSVVHLVPAWRRLYTSGNLKTPRPPNKRNVVPIAVMTVPTTCTQIPFSKNLATATEPIKVKTA